VLPFASPHDLRKLLLLVQRKAALKKIVADTDIQFSESFEIDRNEMFAQPAGQGLGGQMRKAKRKRSPRTPTTVDAYIGARMRERRRALGITQERLGELLGVTFQQVQKYEAGRNRVSAARLFEICEALKVSLASMFKRDLEM